MHFCFKINLIFYFFLFYGTLACAFQSKPASQQLFEHANKIVCHNATYTEAHQLRNDLKCSTNSPLSSVSLNTKIEDLDQAIESSVFEMLANNQRLSLQCSNTKISDYLSDTELRNQLSKIACDQFDLMKEVIKELENTKDNIKTYKSVNDSTIRVIPQEDQNKYEKILIELKKRQNALQSILSNIRQSISLFESQEVFEFAIKQLSTKQDTKKTCELFTQQLQPLLKETQSKIDKSLNTLNNSKLTSDLKEQIWKYARSDEVINKLAENGLTHSSTICRMEARYGKGAEIRDRLIQIAFLGAPPVLKFTESLAIASYAVRSRIPFYISKLVLTTETALSVSLNIYEIKKNCINPKLTVLVNGSNTCNSLNKSERKKNILETQIQNSCLLSATIGAVSTYFSVGAIDKILKGLIPDSLMTKIGESNTKISELISQKGFYDAVEVISTNDEGAGKIVTIARKPTDLSLVRQRNYKISEPDPVFSPQVLIDNMGSASKKLRIETTPSGAYQLPDVALYSNRISQYNAVAASNKKIAITFYKTKDEIQKSRNYNARFIEDGGLPMAPAGTPGSAFTNTGHLHLHDITAHGLSVTIPKEIIDTARTGYRIVVEFEEYLKKNLPELYKLGKKNDIKDLFELTHEQISNTIDVSTGVWTHFVTDMRAGNILGAQNYLWKGEPLFTGSRNLSDVISKVSIYFKVDKKIERAFNEYLKQKKIDLTKPIFTGTENMTQDEYLKFIYMKQQELANAIGTQNF